MLGNHGDLKVGKGKRGRGRGMEGIRGGSGGWRGVGGGRCLLIKGDLSPW